MSLLYHPFFFVLCTKVLLVHCLPESANSGTSPGFLTVMMCSLSDNWNVLMLQLG